MVRTTVLIMTLLYTAIGNAQKMTDIEVKQLNKISSFLDSISHRMIEEIKIIFDGNFGLLEKYTKEDIKSYEFELFEDGYRINFYPMDAYQNQLGFKKTLPEYPNGFLRDTHLDIDQEHYDFDNESDMDRLDEFYITLSKNVVNWFNACWKDAGGLELKDHYVISIHDSNQFFDLTHQKWITYE